ncbi:DedA family protein [Paractinoplanes maris]|uniref:DedA family protein n=1 Tax=Paractinoplanes maris TaxID=1734446 RepID=UPI0020218055|nr:DedA family protein [Actinoplanes maris]
MDLMSLLGPAMTSPLLYPLLAVLGGLDGIVPVVPSEAAILTAGMFSRTGTQSLVLVVAATAAGVFVGDHLVYGLSRSAFGPRLIGRFRWLGRAVDLAGRQLEHRTGPLIVISRFVPGGRVATNVASGTTRVPLTKFSPASAIAAVTWATYHAGLGLLGGAAFVENPLIGLATGLGLSLAVSGIIELIRRRSTLRNSRRKLRAVTVATTAAAMLFLPAPAKALAPVVHETPVRTDAPRWCLTSCRLTDASPPTEEQSPVAGPAQLPGHPPRRSAME